MPDFYSMMTLQHDDSGVRIPSEDDVVELPPFYTPG